MQYLHGRERNVSRMPLTQSVCSEVDHRELGTLGDMGPSSITSCIPPTLMTKSPSLTFQLRLPRFGDLSRRPFSVRKMAPRKPPSSHRLITQLAGLKISPFVSGFPTSILTFLLNTVLPCVVAVPGNEPGLTALLWAPWPPPRISWRAGSCLELLPLSRPPVWISCLGLLLHHGSLGRVHYAIPRSTIDPILTSYKALCSQYRAGHPHRRDDRDMTPTECQAWIQTGLALTPFCGMNTS